jgi:Domain of unknown function (DUF4442)
LSNIIYKLALFIQSPRVLIWLYRFYPPFFFAAIWVKNISDDFTSCDVVIRKSIFTTNLNGSTYGGTLYSGIDPFFAILYWQHFKKHKLHVESWVKEANIKFIKPARMNVYAHFELKDEDYSEAIEAVATNGKFEKNHTIEIKDKEENVIAISTIKVYIRSKK